MKNIKFAATAVLVMFLAACGSVTKKDLGLVKDSPNEFMVMSRAPLSLPPEYDLRPVSAGAEEISEPDDFSRLSQGERAFMKAIGAEKKNCGIREKISEEMKVVYE